MPLSEKDWEAIRNGTAHTNNAPEGCSPLMGMTTDRLKQCLQKPKVRQAIYRETLEICNTVARLIQEDAEINEIYQEFHKLATVKNAFTKIHDFIIQAYDAELTGNIDLKLLEAYSRELEVLWSIAGLPRYRGNGGASIHNLNTTIYTAILRAESDNTEESRKKLADIKVYMLKIVNVISSVINDQTFSPIDKNHIHELSAWMEGFSSTESRSKSYTYNVDGANYEVPTAILDAILMLMPLHVRGSTVEIDITHEDGYIQVSAPLDGEHSSIEHPKSLASYVGRLDSAPFLQWMTEIFPEFLTFYVSDDRKTFGFRIQTKNPL